MTDTTTLPPLPEFVPLPANKIYCIKRECDAKDLDIVAFAWAVQREGYRQLAARAQSAQAPAPAEPSVERMADALRSIREHCAAQPSALAKAIVATCDNGLQTAPAQPASSVEEVMEVYRELEASLLDYQDNPSDYAYERSVKLRRAFRSAVEALARGAR